MISKRIKPSTPILSQAALDFYQAESGPLNYTRAPPPPRVKAGINVYNFDKRVKLILQAI